MQERGSGEEGAAGCKKEGVGRRDIYGKVVRSRKSVAGWQL